MKHPREAFERTKCACKLCQCFCTSMPGYLIPGDVERIAAKRGVTVEAALQFFAASDGATMKDLETGELFRVPTIVPQQDSDGRCIFFEKDGTCMVHEVAPYGCTHFDAHMGAVDGNEKSKAGIDWIRLPQGKRYRKQHAQLVQLGYVSSSVEERREACRLAFEKVEQDSVIQLGERDVHATTSRTRDSEDQDRQQSE